MEQVEARVDLDTSVGYRLKQASSALHNAMDAVLRPLGMSITTYSCLELLAHRPGLSNAELARGAFVTRQSMNVVLQALEKDGLVSRPESAPTGRAIPTDLTPLGRSRLGAASAAVRGVEQRMTARLGPEGAKRLEELLAACVDGLASPDVKATA